MNGSLYWLLGCIALVVRCQAIPTPGGWKCYPYTADDNSRILALGPWTDPASHRPICQQNGRVFTHGNNDAHPGCGTCWCCQPDWNCYPYTSDDNSRILALGPWSDPASHRPICEQHGRVFTHGNNAATTGCGTCWCCKPSWQCYPYTSDDNSKILALGPWTDPASHKPICEQNGRAFTHGNNTNNPGCGTCWCCQPTADWKCYPYTSEDESRILALGPWSDPASHRPICEQNGRVFTHGNNAANSGCGTCWCCQPTAG